MLTNDELATAIKAAVLAVSLVSPFDLAGKEATVKHLERLQQVQAERAAASSVAWSATLKAKKSIPALSASRRIRL